MMRTIDELRRAEDRTPAERAYITEYYMRLGRLTSDMPRIEPGAMFSRAVQVAKTWRSDFAWRLANLVWKRGR